MRYIIAENLIGVAVGRYQNVPGDAAIALALRRIIEHPPEPPPVLEFAAEKGNPVALVRLRWLDSLLDTVGGNLPVEDLMGWLVEKYPERDTSDVLAGFSALVFHRDFQATFTDGAQRAYDTANGKIKASPLTLVST